MSERSTAISQLEASYDLFGARAATALGEEDLATAQLDAPREGVLGDAILSDPSILRGHLASDDAIKRVLS